MQISLVLVIQLVKGVTDKLMSLLNSETCLNLRIRMPITNIDNPRNFITKITTYEKYVL